MSNIIDNIGHAYENTKHFVEEHPWQSAAAALAWPVAPLLVTEAVVAGAVIKHELNKARMEKLGEAALTAGAILMPGAIVGAKIGEMAAEKAGAKAPEGKADKPLSEVEKKTATKIEQLIEAGDVQGLKNELQSHHGRAHELAGIMEQVRKDLLPKGIHTSYSFGSMMWADEKDMHEEGNLSIYKTGGGSAVEIDTDKRMHPSVGGPVRMEKNGTYTNLEMGLQGDPEKILKWIVDGKHD
jgi:hypothetical protein